MALSNWSTLTWDKDGKPSGSKLEAEGVSVEIYKNWLYIRDENSWNEEFRYAKPTIMEMSEGQIKYHGFSIIARSGGNGELFVVAEYNNRGYTEKSQLIGIAAYGYDRDNYVGITDKVKEEFFNWIKTSREDWWFPINVDLDKIKDCEQFNQGDMFFSKELGFKAPVNAGEPLLAQVLKNMEKKCEKDGKIVSGTSCAENNTNNSVDQN